MPECVTLGTEMMYQEVKYDSDTPLAQKMDGKTIYGYVLKSYIGYRF